MINKNELLYKIDAVIDYLKKHNGEEYKVYNHLCPDGVNEPDSNIIEYAEDVKQIIIEMLEENGKENITDFF